jgi:poly(A) polymerase/tRNA nucleotidyltransferase (CCA-adding enzyme)
VVAFSGDIAEDAVRRDFTMNALYATPEGKLIDPLGAMPDLTARRIRFIEDPHARIQEDFLRILRFFRFFAWYGQKDQGFDTEAMDAIAQNTDGLETLSAERVGQEIRKLLGAPDPAFALAGMRSSGVLQTLLPGADDKWVGVIAHFEASLGLPVDWIRRLTVLGGEDVETKLRLSKAETRAYLLSRDIGFGSMPLEEVAYRHGETIAQTTLLFRAAMAEQPPDAAVLENITAAKDAKFPVKAADLIETFQGPALGKRLAKLEQLWIDSGFALKKSELLNHG